MMTLTDVSVMDMAISVILSQEKNVTVKTIQKVSALVSIPNIIVTMSVGKISVPNAEILLWESQLKAINATNK